MEIVTPKTEQIENENRTLIDAVNAIAINDDQVYVSSGEFLTKLKEREKQIAEAFAPSKKAAHDAHKKITALEKSLIEPVQLAHRALSSKIIDYRKQLEAQAAEKARIEAEKVRKAREAEEARLKQEVEAKAALLKEMGLDDEAAEVKAAPVVVNDAKFFVPPVPVQAVAPKIKGLSFSKRKKVKLDNMMDLVKAVAAGKAPLYYLTFDEAKANADLNKMGDAFKVDGLSIVEVDGTIAR